LCTVYKYFLRRCRAKKMPAQSSGKHGQKIGTPK